MKKLITMTLLLMLTFSLSGCNKEEEETTVETFLVNDQSLLEFDFAEAEECYDCILFEDFEVLLIGIDESFRSKFKYIDTYIDYELEGTITREDLNRNNNVHRGLSVMDSHDPFGIYTFSTYLAYDCYENLDEENKCQVGDNQFMKMYGTNKLYTVESFLMIDGEKTNINKVTYKLEGNVEVLKQYQYNDTTSIQRFTETDYLSLTKSDTSYRYTYLNIDKDIMIEYSYNSEYEHESISFYDKETDITYHTKFSNTFEIYNVTSYTDGKYSLSLNKTVDAGYVEYRYNVDLFDLNSWNTYSLDDSKLDDNERFLTIPIYHDTYNRLFHIGTFTDEELSNKAIQFEANLTFNEEKQTLLFDEFNQLIENNNLKAFEYDFSDFYLKVENLINEILYIPY